MTQEPKTANKKSFKHLMLGVCAAGLMLSACESTWLGEDNEVPLEGERIPLFENQASLRPEQEAIDVSAEVRDDIPMRDVTAEEAAAIAATEAALRQMESELRNDPLAEMKAYEDTMQAETAKEAAKQEVIAAAEEAGADTEIEAKAAKMEPIVEAAQEDETEAVKEAAVDFVARKQEERSQIAMEEARVNVADAAVISGFIKPPVWPNEFWPQVGGYGNHAMQHVAFRESGEPKKIWSADIGSGASKDLPLTATPVVVDGKVFTMDSESEIRAFDIKSGRELWSFDARKKSEDDDVIGGGLAFSGGLLFATNGYNEVVAIDPYDGSERWRTGISGPARAAPSAITGVPGRVFVTTLDNQLIALNVLDGSILWEHRGLASNAGLLGSASAAVSRNVVVPAYTSGEVYAVNLENGGAAWSNNLVPARRSDNVTGLTDIRALPVLDKGMIIAMSYAGKLAAIDERTGKTVWEQPIGGAQTPWVAGNRIFVFDIGMNLYALDRSKGGVVWMNELPAYDDPEDREGVINWFGPILAGNRLLAFSDQGEAVAFDPATGQKTAEWDTGIDVVQPPVVAGGRLYLLDDNGTLAAFE